MSPTAAKSPDLAGSTAQTSPPIEATGLGHRYGTRPALIDVTFRVESGELFGFLGPNGGGKSTLFRILSTLMPGSEGEVRLLGYDLSRNLNAARREIGVVFQAPSLDPLLSAREILFHQGHLYGLHGSILKDRVENMLSRFSLISRAGERVSRLSGGVRRRVEIAKSLLHEPRLLILDEPSTGLDPGARREMWTFLRELQEERRVAIVFTTHLMDEAERANRVAILDQGRLVAMNTPLALMDSLGGDVLTVETEDPGSFCALVRDRFDLAASVLDGRVRMEMERGHEFVATLAEAFPGKVRSVSVGKPTLEDVFIHLTGRGLHEAEDDNELAMATTVAES